MVKYVAQLLFVYCYHRNAIDVTPEEGNHGNMQTVQRNVDILCYQGLSSHFFSLTERARPSGHNQHCKARIPSW